MNRFVVSILVIVFFFSNLNIGLGQNGADENDILNKTVVVSAYALPLDRLFDLLSTQTGNYFTYDADIVDGTRLITLELPQTTLKITLDTLLHNTQLTYQIVNNQIVIYQISKPSIIQPGISENLTISGWVIDALTNQGLGFASVMVKNSYVGCITNENGFFTLRIPKKFINDSVSFSYIGYYNTDIPILGWLHQRKVPLQSGMVSIQEVIVRSNGANAIVKRAIELLNDNFYIKPYNFEAFYRESVEKDDKYMLYSEALINGYKPAFGSEIVPKIQLQKARKFSNLDKNDTLLVKLRGGMESCFQLDLSYRLPEFLAVPGFENYAYTLSDIVIWQNVMVYAVGFKPQKLTNEPQFEGTVYISVERFAVLGAEFSLTKAYLNREKNLFVVRKTKQISVQPVSAKYTINYGNWNGKYFSKYVSGNLLLKVRKRRQFFANSYGTQLEMVYTNIDTLSVAKPERKELFETSAIFFDTEYKYDQTFWDNNNIINPEENIIEALKKSGFKLQEQSLTP